MVPLHNTGQQAAQPNVAVTAASTHTKVDSEIIINDSIDSSDLDATINSQVLIIDNRKTHNRSYGEQVDRLSPINMQNKQSTSKANTSKS